LLVNKEGNVIVGEDSAKITGMFNCELSTGVLLVERNYSQRTTALLLIMTPKLHSQLPDLVKIFSAKVNVSGAISQQAGKSIFNPVRLPWGGFCWA